MKFELLNQKLVTQLTKAQFYVMNAIYLVLALAIITSAYNLTTNA